MPCLGLTSLHKNYYRHHKHIIECVNALSRAHVSAPPQMVLGKLHPKGSCQCPVSGSRLCTGKEHVGR